MHYRRRLSEDCLWHWHPNCSKWPSTSFFETWVAAGLDTGCKLCLECCAIDRVAQVFRNRTERPARVLQPAARNAVAFEHAGATSVLATQPGAAGR